MLFFYHVLELCRSSYSQYEWFLRIILNWKYWCRLQFCVQIWNVAWFFRCRIRFAARKFDASIAEWLLSFRRKQGRYCGVKGTKKLLLNRFFGFFLVISRRKITFRIIPAWKQILDSIIMPELDVYENFWVIPLWFKRVVVSGPEESRRVFLLAYAMSLRPIRQAQGPQAQRPEFWYL